MTILVTGMTSSQTRKDRPNVAAWIADSLASSGYDVVVEKPSLERTLDGEEWEHVFVGMGPLHGLGTSSMYGALGLIGTHGQKGNLTLYVDDTDTGKIGGGLRTMRNNPHNLVKPFFVYKREHALASKPEVHEWLLKVIDWILKIDEKDAPRTIVPAYRFDTAFSFARLISPELGARAVGVDFSDYVATVGDLLDLPDDIARRHVDETEESVWGASAPETSRVVKSFMPGWTVEHIWPAAYPERFLELTGYLHGWSGWSPLFMMAAAARMPVATDWREHTVAFGDSYELLAPSFESMTPEERDEIAESQAKSFFSVIMSREQIADEVLRSMK